MLLGAGELGKEVLIALQRLGVETIAVDRYENAPGQQVAHHARTIAMSDAQQLKALIEAERPDVVVPEIEAIATPMLEELEAAGVVRVIPTARAARLTMNREGIRRLAAVLRYARRVAGRNRPLPAIHGLRGTRAPAHRTWDPARRHWLSMHRQAGHEFFRQGPE
jgi:hypothetical protein